MGEGGNASGDDVIPTVHLITRAAHVVTFDSDGGVGLRLVRAWRLDIVTVSALVGVYIA